ncbi:FmdE family protein [Desulfosarcina ovata]|uniref:FmdE family protein n=1 Tax=Desulfosarcina ovata TaxID=83564 RepID=UPI001390FC85|nr:FmdE family protein [Desulfosarcina ovata]
MKTVVVSISMMFLLITGFAFSASARDCSTDSDYTYWKTVGRQAATKAVKMLSRSSHRFNGAKGYIALTNAGYAEVDEQSTMAALDGLVQVLGVGRGDNSLVEIHSAAEKALWFAVYQPRSGYCAYLEVDPDAVYAGCCGKHKKSSQFFSTTACEKINAEHLYANEEIYAEKFDAEIFGGNEFRIVTIANAVAEGAPVYAIRAFEFHDHYCPGVTSGIIEALYAKSYFSNPGGSYFVHTVQPWCKEDAFLSMLNATPGKRGYAVAYATDADIDGWPEWADGDGVGDVGVSADTIVYYQDPDSGVWDGIVLGFDWADLSDTCGNYTNSTINKLCMDLYYLEKMDEPETFVKVLAEFELNGSVVPKSLARPGVDTINVLESNAASFATPEE